MQESSLENYTKLMETEKQSRRGFLKIGAALALIGATRLFANSHGDQQMVGFCNLEGELVKEGYEKVAEKYFLPDVLYYKGIAPDELSLGRAPGFVRDNSNLVLPSNFKDHGSYQLVLLASLEEHLKCLEQLSDLPYHVPSARPMVRTVVHELGHIYLSLLDSKNVDDLISEFWDIDSKYYQTRNVGLFGQPSYYSTIFTILPGSTHEDELLFLHEQFAETFTYHILGHTYKEGDKDFLKKRDLVVGSLGSYSV